MPRNRNELSDGYHKAFPTALRALMEQDRTTQQELALTLGKTRQSVSYYCDGSSSPDWETIAKIAEFFSVSADYLLGLSDDPAQRPAAVDDLGLSPKAVQHLKDIHELNERYPIDTRQPLLEYLLEDLRFHNLLAWCARYVTLMSITPDVSFSESAAYTACADTLKAHGFTISSSDDQAGALFSERIVNMLRTLLNERAEYDQTIHQKDDH